MNQTIQDALHEVLLHPELNEPRRRYTDQVESEDPERAEFIRLQLRLKTPEFRELPLGERRKVERRQYDLYQENKDRWFGEVQEIVDDSFPARGFITLAGLPATDFAESGAQLFSLAPIQHLDLTKVSSDSLALALEQKGLHQIRSLSLKGGSLGDADLKAIAQAPTAQNLRWLDLFNQDVTADGLRWLASHPELLPKLQLLGVRRNPVGPLEDEQTDQGYRIHVEVAPIVKEIQDKYGDFPWLHPLDAPSRYSYSTGD